MSNIQELLNEEISRKEFIRYIGLALIGMMGVTSFLQNLTKNLSSKNSPQKTGANDYGASAYGG